MVWFGNRQTTNVIEDFESGSLDSGYSGDTGVFSVQSTTALSGTYSLEGRQTGNIIHDTYSIPKGSEFSALMQFDGGGGTEDGFLMFGFDGSLNGYRVKLDESDDFTLIERNDGTDIDVKSATITSNTLYRIDVTWDDGTLGGSDNDITADIVDTSDGSTVQTLSGNDSTHADHDRVGWRVNSQNNVYFDDLILK